MTKYEQIANVIGEILEDGQEHAIEEFRIKCKETGIDLETNKNIISNVVFSLKKKGEVKEGKSRGTYLRMEEQTLNDRKKERDESNNSLELDWNKYFVLMPQDTRYHEKKLTITEKGEIRLNSLLQRSIKSKTVEFIFSKDYKEVIINENGKNPHKLTKAGTAKNHEIVERLKKIKIKFPISYTISWDEMLGMWKGAINISNKV